MVFLINTFFNYLSNQDYKKAIETAIKAVNLHPESFDANLCLGTLYAKIGQLDLALANLKKAQNLTQDKKDLVIIYNLFGLIYKKNGDTDKALHYFSKCLRLAIELENKSIELNALINLAKIFYSNGWLDKALNYYKKALEITLDDSIRAFVYDKIGSICYDKADYTEALHWFKKMLKAKRIANDYGGSAHAMLKLGNTYRKIKKFDLAFYYLQEGLKRVQMVEDKHWEAIGWIYLGKYFKDKGDEQLAKDYFDKSYELFCSIGEKTFADTVLANKKHARLNNN